MQWDDVRLFLAVARQGKLSDAAARLELDEATISRRIRRLEQDMGTRLFERTRRGHQLTSAGEKLEALAETMEQAALAAHRDVAGREDTAAGTVRLSVAEGFGSRLVAPALVRFHRQYPDIEIDLVAGTGFLSPSKREADIAVGLSRPTAGQIFVRRLADYRLGLFASEAYLNQQGPIASLDALHQHSLIGYVDDLIFAPELRYLDEALPGFRTTIRSSSINAQYEMIKSGLGLGILPAFMVSKGDGVVPVLEKEVRLTRSFWISVHQDIRALPRIRAVLAFLDGLVKSPTNRQAWD